MDTFSILWIVWGTAFLVIEGTALFNKKNGDTLSEKTWKIFDILGPRRLWWKRIVLIVFLVWLLLHLSFGWLTPTHPLPWR
jgi:hypothetical protein